MSQLVGFATRLQSTNDCRPTDVVPFVNSLIVFAASISNLAGYCAHSEVS